ARPSSRTGKTRFVSPDRRRDKDQDPEAVRLRFSTPARRLSAALHVESRRLTAGTRTRSGRLLPSRWTGKTPSSPTGAAKGADCRKGIFDFPEREGGRLPTFNTGQKRPWPFRCAPC